MKSHQCTQCPENFKLTLFKHYLTQNQCKRPHWHEQFDTHQASSPTTYRSKKPGLGIRQRILRSCETWYLGTNHRRRISIALPYVRPHSINNVHQHNKTWWKRETNLCKIPHVELTLYLSEISSQILICWNHCSNWSEKTVCWPFCLILMFIGFLFIMTSLNIGEIYTSLNCWSSDGIFRSVWDCIVPCTLLDIVYNKIKYFVSHTLQGIN